MSLFVTRAISQVQTKDDKDAAKELLLKCLLEEKTRVVRLSIAGIDCHRSL
jgi:hypothetical protein